MQAQFNVPILFLVFNRPSTTTVVFEAIRKIKPSKLYLAADGPRQHKDGEQQKCEEVRKIITAIDWPCQVKKLFREENLGCGKGVSSGITWFFEHEPEGIILEDDCVPDLTFFPYCEELLDRYRNDKRIMEISGNNIWTTPSTAPAYSYSFSNHNGIWGWASWRRAWNHYDYEMKIYPTIKNKGYLEKTFNSIYERDYFKFVFERTYLFPHITWDYQWELIKRINTGLTIVPSINMVENIGFGTDATNTTNVDNPATRLQSAPMIFPLKHPPYMVVDAEADRQAFIKFHSTRSSRLKTFIKSSLPVIIQNKLFEAAIGRFIQQQKKAGIAPRASP
ncbi:nucleotide-diphospho-sugar transferase [Chryseolinea sp. H1M3-3]|uniref:nucleotide-diphospho-sugar transferase n=1 Tax=Chryseolinea sp. H1M3-3 TaxID=3034144 RepID=UPI0023EB8948|nr:nucleotide-diphospho-sugar transferase [Chryseolinea sp. H1M3-3]